MDNANLKLAFSKVELTQNNLQALELRKFKNSVALACILTY